MNNTSFQSILTRNILNKCLKAGRQKYSASEPQETCKAAKIDDMVKKLREKTPIGKLDELEEGKHPYQEKEPLTPFPGGVNPDTGEVGGPRGPEPTRYGDWERKGRVTDF